MSEALILLPGLMCDARVYSEQILAFNGDRAVHLAPVCKSGAIAAIARQVLDTAPRHFALAGHGLGGVIAMEMIRQAPERVTRVALMCCTPLAETPQEAAAREPRIVCAQAGRLEKALLEQYPSDCLAPGSAASAVQDEILQMGLALGTDVFVRQSRAMQRRLDQQKVLRQFRAPALILCGAHDTLTPPRRHEFMAEMMPNATLEIIEDAGHMPLLERPDAVTRAFRDWLGSPLLLS